MLQQHATHEFLVELRAAWEHLQQQLQACQIDTTPDSDTYIHGNTAAIGSNRRKATLFFDSSIIS